MITVLCIPAVYFLSYAFVISFFKRWPQAESNAVLRIYRPLFLAAPTVMTSYSQLCGLTDVEAFLLKEAMIESNVPLDEFDVDVAD